MIAGIVGAIPPQHPPRLALPSNHRVGLDPPELNARFGPDQPASAAFAHTMGSAVAARLGLRWVKTHPMELGR